MRLRAFVAVAALAGAFGVAGWMANAISAWNAGTGELSEAARPAAAAAASNAVPKGVQAARPEHLAGAPALDLGLLSPDPLYVAPAQRAAAAASPLAEAARAEESQPVQATRAALPAAEAKRSLDPKELKALSPAAQVSRIKAALKISPEQEEYWQPVEAMLLEIARQQGSQKTSGRKLAVPAEFSQRLYWTAGPLIMSLRDDQKREARNLARAMGLTQVASLI